jgi:signal transduction histidine kinase
LESSKGINQADTKNSRADFQNTKMLLEQSSPLYLLVSEEGELEELGSLWNKVTLQSEVNYSFEEEFILSGYENFIDLKKRHSKGNVLFFNHRKSGLKFKSSFFRIDLGYVFLVNPVVNSDYPLKSFHMDLNDFPDHSYIAESIFLSEISMKGLTEAQELNIKLNKRNSELKSSLEKVEKLRLELEQFNLNLESLVEEKTKENVSLQANINEIEKFVAIGEMTMGIAHDLNNPLSAILIGVQNLSSSIEFLHQNLIYSFSREEIAFADKHCKTSNAKAFQSTLQMMKDRNVFQNFLEEQKGYATDEAFEIADRMVKVQIEIDDSSKIDRILAHPSPKLLLEMIFHMSVVHQMLTTISVASNRSAEVVSDLRKFTKGSFEQDKLSVNLLDSINGVLRVLSSNYRRNINFEIDVPNTIEIQAVPREIYQIWANVIKNGIEAIGDKGGTIWIRAKQTNEGTKVEFKNDGPKIPEEFIDVIFDRFKSSKGRDNFGYGLNIVKKIIESNHWQVEVRSDDNSTSFIFLLNEQKYEHTS